MKKTKITFNKPVYCGMVILDISKSLMYDFHYGYILPKYGKNQKLLFTDTDSLCYEIETEDFYKDISSIGDGGSGAFLQIAPKPSHPLYYFSVEWSVNWSVDWCKAEQASEALLKPR